MKQVFSVSRGDSKDELVVREFAELEKNETSLTMEKRYSIKPLKKAAASGVSDIVACLRTEDFFPPESIAEKIANGILELLDDPQKEAVEVVTDDVAIMMDEEMLVDDELDGQDDIDDLLDDDDIPLDNVDDDGSGDDLS